MLWIDRGGCGVGSFGDFGVAVSVELDAEEAPGCAVACDAHPDAVAPGVVGLVVVGLGLDGERVETGRPRFMVA